MDDDRDHARPPVGCRRGPAGCRRLGPAGLLRRGRPRRAVRPGRRPAAGQGRLPECPVVAECLADALDNRTEFGVWGGMTERERRALLKRRPDITSWAILFAAARGQSRRRARPPRPTGRTAGGRPRSSLTLPPYGAGSSASGAGSAAGECGAHRAQPGAGRGCPAARGRAPARRRHAGVPGGEPARRGCACRAAASARPACRRSSPAVGEVAPRSARSRRRAARPPPGRAARSAGAATRWMRLTTSAGERHPAPLEPVDEVRRLAQRVALGGGDDDERRRRLLEQRVGDVGALAEPAEHRVERGDEGLHVGEQLAAEHLGHRAGDDR